MIRSLFKTALASSVVCAASWSVAQEGSEVWKYTVGGEIFGSPAADAEGNVYFGSRDGKLYSLNAQGELRWAYATSDWVESSPTLNHDESAVYVGSWDNKLHAVSTVNGSPIWSFETGSLIVASPALDAAGNLFFGSSDGFFYSLDATGKLRWTYLVGSEMDASPAVASDGNVYVGAFDGSLYAFSNSGALLWKFATQTTTEPEDQRIKSPPTIDAEGNIYFGGGDGHLYALNRSGEEQWRFAARDKVDTGIALGANGSIIFGSRDGYVYSVDAFGVTNWESYVGDVYYSTPAIDEFGRVYVGAYLGNGVSGVSVLSMSGELLWESLTLSYIDSSPLLSGDGLLYFGDYEGNFHAVEAYAAAGRSAWNRFGGDRSNRGEQNPLYEWFAASPVYSDWLQARGLFGETATPAYDGDGDGLGVLIEYWLGGDPTVPRSDLAEMAVLNSSAGGVIALEFNRPKGETRLGIALVYSTDLDQWHVVDEAQFGVTEEVLNSDAFGDGLYETVRISLEASGALYLRVVASTY